MAYICDNPESEFKVCAANPKIVNLDVERCATLDHVGRPIGEYGMYDVIGYTPSGYKLVAYWMLTAADEPDNYLQCVGYWQENQQSYLVTYDTEDPVSPFRCWVSAVCSSCLDSAVDRCKVRHCWCFIGV